MKTDQFAKEIARRFDSKFSKQSDIDDFVNDAKNLLKFYEGQILEWTLNEIIATNRTRTHPTIATIKGIASKIAGEEKQKQEPVSPDTMKMVLAESKKKEFKQTDLFRQCCMDMIGNDALLFVERNIEFPTQGDISDMKRAHRELIENMQRLKADPDLSDIQVTIYKLGRDTYLKNLNLKRVAEGKAELTEQEFNKAA